KASRENIAHQRERQARHLGGRSTAKEADVLGKEFEPLLEFTDQTGLAESSLTDNRNYLRFPRRHDALECGLEALQLLRPADHLDFEAFDPTQLPGQGARFGAQDETGLHRLGPAFDLKRR